MYNISAFLYDAIAAFEQPETLCDELSAIFKQYNITQPGLLGDFGAGTGLMSVLLAQAGWHVLGIEVSEAMRAVAQEKTVRLPPQLQQRLTWQAGDITAFTLPDGLLLDGAVCLCNTLNHLPQWSQVEDFARCAFLALRPGGVLILDSDTQRTFQGFFHHESTVVWDDGQHQMTRACRFDETTGRAEHQASLSQYDANGQLRLIGAESMTLQYHRESELFHAFSAAGFGVESAEPFNPNPVLYHPHTFGEAEEFTPKILWVLRKPA